MIFFFRKVAFLISRQNFEKFQISFQVTTVHIASEKGGDLIYSQKGTQPLAVKNNLKAETSEYFKMTDRNAFVTLAAGCQPLCGVQIMPPTAITSIALHADWSLVAVGLAYGLVLYNFEKKVVILKKCHLSPDGKSLHLRQRHAKARRSNLSSASVDGATN